MSSKNQAGAARRFVRLGPRAPFLAAVVTMMGFIGAGGTAQEKKPYPIFTSEHFVPAMKTVGQAFTAVNGALERNEIDDAKAYLAITRDRLATTITFWRDRHKDDAVRILRSSLARLDELDVALSTETVDRAKVADIARQAQATCEACHAAYRDQDPATKEYRFKGDIDR